MCVKHPAKEPYGGFRNTTDGQSTRTNLPGRPRPKGARSDPFPANQRMTALRCTHRSPTHFVFSLQRITPTWRGLHPLNIDPQYGSISTARFTRPEWGHLSSTFCIGEVFQTTPGIWTLHKGGFVVNSWRNIFYIYWQKHERCLGLTKSMNCDVK